jgi:hypothetical protein
MSEPTIEQINEAIALFMGAKIDDDGNVMFLQPADGIGLAGCGKHALRYHSSWDWLMPVVEKIHKLKEWQADKKELRLFSTITFDIEFDGHYKECRCSIIGTITHCHNESIPHTYTNVPVPHIWINKKKTAIEATYQAVYQFIQWYNKQKEDKV